MSMKVLKRKCPICNSDHGDVLREIKMILANDICIPGTYDVVCCTECGFTYADVDATQEQYDKYYACDNSYTGDKEIKSTGKKKSVLNMIEYIKKYVGKDAKILDAGCGSGELLTSLKEEAYCDLWGLDPSKDAVKILKKHQINGFQQNVFDKWICQEKFDVIISTCVMEHIYDIRGFMEVIRGHIKPGGMFYVVVPAVEGFEQNYQSLPNYFNQEHINYFSSNSLMNLMYQQGFEPVSVGSESYYMVTNSTGNGDLMLQNVYRYTGKSKENSLLYDNSSKKSIINYYKLVDEDDRLLQLQKQIEDEQKCVLWGAGALTMSLLVNTLFDAKVDFLVDNNLAKQGKDICGKMVYAPEVLLDEANVKKTIIIACMQYAEEIKQQIKEMGLKNKVIVY